MPSERQVFSRLFVGRQPVRPSEFKREIMVLGLLNYYKWDQVFAWEEEHGGQTIPPDEIQFTDQQIYDFETTVAETLEDYLESMRPTRGFFYGVWQSVVGSFVYSVGVAVLLVVAYVLLKARDIDLLETIFHFIERS